MDKPMQNTLAVLAKLTVENADLKVKVVALEAGLETIFRYTGDTRHPNGVWDAHVIAERLLAGFDHNGRVLVPPTDRVASSPEGGPTE